MSNVYTLRDVENRRVLEGPGHRLGSIHESELKDKISELNSFNHILEQERDDLNSKKHELEAEVGCKDSEITSLGTKLNELEKLEQQISQLSHESNIIGGAKEDPNSAKSLLQETNTHLAEQVSKASSETNKVIGGAPLFLHTTQSLNPMKAK
ncbi:7641_t:CDS:2 [Dentiscutata heterogama]|uniref:7641_t:CDS:1 n=1 Tax=Dentiscutata heterogama TaxID=1316150 RepID=A0ACA9JZU7_9GLOM|nr:7641_t:CDS:2 [Dentiscutata heterogama]